MEELSLFVVSHKKVDSDQYKDRKIIYVGPKSEELKTNEDFVDSTFDNIADKNYTYCEMTAIYWLWKNYHDCKYIGIEHYRRLFGPFCGPYMHGFKKEWFIKTLKKYQAIAFMPPIVIKALTQWELTYDSIYINELENAIEKLFPDYLEDFHKVLNARQLSFCNMLVTSKEIFDDYCSFVFPVLFETEKHIEISDEPYQQRMMGFLAERLVSVYIIHNNIKTKPVMISGCKNGYIGGKKKNGRKKGRELKRDSSK